MAGDFFDLESFPADWPKLRIGDFAAVKGGKRLPLGTALVSNRTAHPYLRIVDFKDGRIDKSALMFLLVRAFLWRIYRIDRQFGVNRDGIV